MSRTKVILRNDHDIPRSLMLELGARVVDDEYNSCVYTWNLSDGQTIYANKEVNKNGTTVVIFWRDIEK